MAQNTRNNKGITLLTLIVLIILLLILASVTLATITGDEGILMHTQNAKDATELNDNREQGVMKNILDMKK